MTLRGAALIFVVLVTAMLPNAASARVDEPALVVALAEAQIGSSFRLGMEGPTRFDCSGLVHYVFSQAGLLDRIGGQRLTAREYYKWARERGLLAKTDPRVGDLVLWTHYGRIKHIGIYVGTNERGKPLAISALTTGVARHRVDRISLPFFSYIHTGLTIVPDPTPPPTPSPSPSPSPSATPTPTPTPSPTPSELATPIPT